MKQKVSDYIADQMADAGICHVFTVTGGGAMHLNDSFGHHKRLECIYQHHEQACAMAAEAYARVKGKMAAVCVTTGPGATNAVTGVLGAWMDSIPMVVISGQARYETTVPGSGLRLRSMGVQECNIVPVVKSITKYAVMVTKPEEIRYHLERGLYLACHGRPGPVWLDIPLDIQGAWIDTQKLAGYDPNEDAGEMPADLTDELVEQILEQIQNSHRPVLFPGNGVRLSGAMEEFRNLVQLLGIPVVTGPSSVDALPYAHPLYVGKSGSTGDRAGNFAVQNSDLFFSIGSRMGFGQTGFHYQSWARQAYTIICDIDEEELKKPNLHVNLPVHADAGALIRKITGILRRKGCDAGHPFWQGADWSSQCALWKSRYPVVTAAHYREQEKGCTNIYAFYEELSKVMKEGETLVVSVGTARVAGTQAFRVKEGQRFITNPNTAAMGFCLPAATGASIALDKGAVVCVTGEGSLQMNLQELQTIWHHQLPIKLFVINNQGYHSIRQTQQSYFGEPLVGVGPESGDLSFPSLKKLATAYGYAYDCCGQAKKLAQVLSRVLMSQGPVLCEIFVTKYQKTEPKAASKKLPDGRMVSAPLEDLAPFLPREELEENMWIPLYEQERE